MAASTPWTDKVWLSQRTALDSSASFLGGVDLVQAFVGQRDAGGTLVGTASFALSPTLAPGAWSLTASIPGDITGGRDLVVYGRSSVSGQEAFVSIPILNLATPLFATAFMVHVHKQIARRASLPFRGGSRA